MSIVDMCRRKKELTIDFELNIDKWKTMNEDVKNVVSEKWYSVKFLNEAGNDLNGEIKNIPNDKGGVYVFLLKPDLISNIHLYIMYIGRARRKNEYSLRKRCREYLKDNRPEVAYMRETWGEYLYLPIDDDSVIEEVERELLRVIIPPCNSQIPDRYVEVMPEQKAF